MNQNFGKTKRIMIAGCPGAGKSTLAQKLGELLEIPVIHLDRLFWKEGWQASTAGEFDEKLLQAMEAPSWIVDGNYRRTFPLRLERCDLVVYLDYNRWTCIMGALKRVIQYHGQQRPDMGEGCPEKADLEFLLYIWKFRKNHGRDGLRMIQESEKPYVLLRNRKEADAWFAELAAHGDLSASLAAAEKK